MEMAKGGDLEGKVSQAKKCKTYIKEEKIMDILV